MENETLGHQNRRSRETTRAGNWSEPSAWSDDTAACGAAFQEGAMIAVHVDFRNLANEASRARDEPRRKQPKHGARSMKHAVTKPGARPVAFEGNARHLRERPQHGVQVDITVRRLPSRGAAGERGAGRKQTCGSAPTYLAPPVKHLCRNNCAWLLLGDGLLRGTPHA